MYRKAVSAVVFALILAISLKSQDFSSMVNPQGVNVRGEIYADQLIHFQELFIEVRDDNSGKHDRITVMPDGSFTFYSLPVGNYRLQVLTQHGDVLKEDFISVSPTSAPHLEIHLKANSKKVTPADPVSYRRLSHKPSKDAVRAWKQAKKFVLRGDHKTAIVHLERSVQLDSEYFEAYFTLGGQKLMAGDLNGALIAYDKALEIDPLFTPALISRGVILLQFQRPQEAEQLARKALQITDSESAHYVLGMSLAVQGENLPDAIEHLKLSEVRHPQAAKTVSYLQSQIKPQNKKTVNSLLP